MNPKTFVILVKYPGLGDHLFFSHIPKAAKTLGFERVLISNRSGFRSAEYAEYVWNMNPYVDGFTDESAPCPDGFAVPPDMNLLDSVMLNRGIDDGLRWHEPEIYYEPEIDPALADEVVFDPNFATNAGTGVGMAPLQSFLMEERVTAVMPTRDSGFNIGERKCISTDGTLARYCQIIASCKRFLCFASGGATLAAALGIPAKVVSGPYVNQIFLHSKMHTYVRLGATH